MLVLAMNGELWHEEGSAISRIRMILTILVIALLVSPGFIVLFIPDQRLNAVLLLFLAGVFAVSVFIVARTIRNSRRWNPFFDSSAIR